MCVIISNAALRWSEGPHDDKVVGLEDSNRMQCVLR